VAGGGVAQLHRQVSLRLPTGGRDAVPGHPLSPVGRQLQPRSVQDDRCGTGAERPHRDGERPRARGVRSNHDRGRAPQLLSGRLRLRGGVLLCGDCAPRRWRHPVLSALVVFHAGPAQRLFRSRLGSRRRLRSRPARGSDQAAACPHQGVRRGDELWLAVVDHAADRRRPRPQGLDARPQADVRAARAVILSGAL
jgi:hypothetical protein